MGAAVHAAPAPPKASGRVRKRIMQATSSPKPLLLPRVAAGDANAVQECLDRFGPLVWSLVRGSISDPGLAEDVVQEVFIDLWRSAGRYDESRSSESTFVATIARRRVIDQRRKQGRRPAHEVLEDEREGEPDTGLVSVETADEAAQAMQALEVLRPDQRRVLKLAILQGMTHQEISTSIGMPLGTVKSHVRRGLDRVSTALRAARAAMPGGEELA